MSDTGRVRDAKLIDEKLALIAFFCFGNAAFFAFAVAYLLKAEAWILIGGLFPLILHSGVTVGHLRNDNPRASFWAIRHLSMLLASVCVVGLIRLFA